jgi:hypothetical protein
MSGWKRRSWRLLMIWRGRNGRLLLLLRMVIIGNPLEK